MKVSRSAAAFGVATLLFVSTLFLTCKNDPGPIHGGGGAVDSVTPQPVPGTSITGITFPENPATINGWISSYDSISMAQHAWGLWAGLTSQTTQMAGGESLLVFETWLGPNEMTTLMQQGGVNCDAAIKLQRTPLSRPHQFHGMAGAGTGVVADSNLMVTVAYSPPAACYAITNNIFKEDVLKSFAVPDGIGNVPAFPSDGITLKPTYMVAKPKPGEKFALPVWPGNPIVAQNYPDFSSFWQWVFVDVNNGGAAGAVTVPVSSVNEADPAKIAAATVNLNQFIYFTIDSAMAAFINHEQGPGTAAKGNLAILMGMHVATREISNWTWQTFFWAPDPANPPFPSLPYIAQQRPSSKLSAAASHYAASIAYEMVLPKVAGASIPPADSNNAAVVKYHIGYNPYLEPGLGPITQVPNLYDSTFQWGVQSNCMTCHSLARFDPSMDASGNQNNHVYSADQNISPTDLNLFRNMVKVDFAWSIPGNTIPAPKGSSK
jgi:hypothetical protein